MRTRDAPVERCLVGRVIEHLQELASPEVEHELRVDAEVVRQPEAHRVVLPAVHEPLAQADEHAVQLARHVGRVVS